VALKFGPAEYFSLMVFGLIAAVVLARGSVLKAIAMVCFGILLGLVGTDVNSGTIRFGFGAPELTDGIGFVALAMAFFGITDVVVNLEHTDKTDVYRERIGSVLPSLHDLRTCFWSIARGTALGSILGILPGGGALLASFAAYMFEKKVAKPPRSFGEGDIRGVAAPESANNAGAQTSFIPMLTLGIPSNPTMALMIGALMIQGIAPGPQVMTERPELFWGLVASMWVGNLMLLVLNLPLIGLWVKLLAVPYRLLFPAIFVFCCIGVFTVDNKIFDIYVLAALSAVAYVLLKLDCEPAPLILGFILGPMMEEQMRRAMMINFGDATIFLTRPLSAAFLIAAAILMLLIALPSLRAKREVALQE
jgi:TctA family transporter